MTQRIDLKRGFLAAVTAAAVALALLLVAGGSPASATHVKPVWYDGNVNCTVAPGADEVLRLENGSLGNGTHPVDGGSITISNLTEKTFDWSSSGVVISAVFIKAGNGGWLYSYEPDGASADTGLDSGDHAISHITFCTGGTASTTTTEAESTTTTTEATTTTTEAESTTTTTIPDEVSPTSIVNTTTTIVSTTAPDVSPETLPFTGAESGTPAALALLLIAGGALALVGASGFRTDTDE